MSIPERIEAFYLLHDGISYEAVEAFAGDVEQIARADERERIADLVQMKFSMTSARSHDSGCVCHLCAINSTVDAAVDWLRGGESE